MGVLGRDAGSSVEFVKIILGTGLPRAGPTAGEPTTRERMPRGEAVHYRERALELGVPSSALLVEPNARITGEKIHLVGALQRLLVYPAQGLTIAQSVPRETLAAYKRLCSAGFTSRLTRL
ncbi:hypothetical protein ACIQUZ_17730 [Streptomyces griseus]|uniref:hypothetical protein n=1 Tax=Streptomyces griseus TaxID=1911 RepID=UPI0037FCD360